MFDIGEPIVYMCPRASNPLHFLGSDLNLAGRVNVGVAHKNSISEAASCSMHKISPKHFWAM